MTTVEYDLHISGGLMNQIQSLISPPTSDITNKRRKLKKSNSHQNQLTNDNNNNNNNNSNNNNKGSILSRQTKTGKTPNHEYCDSCREGGDLLCCDRCPNAFHLQCHDPPLDEEDVPQGEWACRKCKVLEQFVGEDNHSEHESIDSQTFVENKCQSIESEEEMPLKSEMSERELIQKPLSVLIKAAQVLNPKQFQLPNEMMPSIQLIGSKKINTNSHHFNKNVNKKQTHELENGLVSFPIKLCYQCSKSCRKAPLIQCDYCPLLFHADCVDPPMTVLPIGRWMCPNHAQHVIEQKLLDSDRLSDRIKLWNQFSGHISQDTIKIDFLKKVHRKHPPFRQKISLSESKRVIVPEGIKQMYKSPPHLLPNITQSVNDCIYSDVNYVNEVKNECLKNDNFERPSLKQQEEWLKNIIAFQASVAQHLLLTKNSESKIKSSNDDNSIISSNDTNLPTIYNKDNIDSHLKSNESLIKYNNNSKHSVNGPSNHTLIDIKSPKECKTSDISEPLTKMTENMIHLNGIPTLSSPSCSPIGEKRISTPTNSIHTNVENIVDIDIDKLDEKLIRVLAFQRLQQLVSKSPENNVNLIGTQNSNTLTASHPTVKRICLGDVRARAVLCPVFIRSSTGTLNQNTSGPAIAMSYRTLTIGTGADNDVILGNYGHCNYVSGRHACIFYDETSKHYELINYSEHGTTVDNVLYSCDFSDKKVHNPKYSLIDSQTVSTVKTIIESKGKRKFVENNRKIKNLSRNESITLQKGKKRKIIKKEETDAQISELKPNKISYKKDYRDSGNIEKVSVQVQSQNISSTMSSRAGQTWKPCSCKSSCSTLIGGNGAGWEGTALLHHGSYLKIGCNQFVFSITNYGITQNSTNTSTISKTAVKSEPSSSTKCH